tara:strand:- start:440 stop:673 length:234 start_codon:yes stop_codon:yes gene_type:complete
MSKKLEPLKIDDIIEVKEIKKLLSESKSKLDLLTMFEWIETIANKKINNVVIKSIIDDEEEEDILPELSDHSSDEDE